MLTKGKLPAAHLGRGGRRPRTRLGIRSSSTMMYGHVDHPRHWLGHFRVLAGVQDRTGGFTEFVALPFVHTNAPIYLAGIARPGPTWRENRVVHAMARLLLHGRIANIQCSWVKLGDEGTAAMLSGGCNDLGGTLMEETISPDGRLGARLGAHGGRADRDRHGGRAPGAPAHHHLPRPGRAAGPRRPPRPAPAPPHPRLIPAAGLGRWPAGPTGWDEGATDPTGGRGSGGPL